MTSKLVRKWRRRRPGIYLFRTDKHIGRGRHNGYVGRSNNVHLRRQQHLVGRQTIQMTEYGEQIVISDAKPWADLNPRQYVMRLPWWLGWVWVLAPLEWLAIKVLLPVYNYQHNRTNPRRVPLAAQRNQRAARDAARRHGYTGTQRLYRAARFHVLRPVYGLSLIVIGLSGWWFTR